ncbi:MAG TPA: hypothetical protein VFK18_05000, partial [Luteimonas sp.]|nr:hypothetical protein [Luteimonas sp.]
AGADNITMTEAVEVTTELGDIIIGRTTGFQVLMTLPAGTTFNGDPVLAAGPGLTGGWNVVLVAGGDGENQAQFTVSPTAAGSTVEEGIILQIAALSLDGVPTADGAKLVANFLLRDPVSTATLHQDSPVLIERTDGLAFTCTAQMNPDQIDVGTNVTFTTAKTGLVGADVDYDIGAADATIAPLGTISVAATAGFVLNVAAAGDTLTSQIDGNFTSFNDVFLATDATCATPLASYTINATKTRASLDVEFNDLNTAGGTFTAAGGTATLCVEVNGTTPVVAQTFKVQNGLNTVLEADACAVAPLDYNGSVVKVYHVNPAANPTAQTFVRVINPSATDGLVTVTGFDDDGHPGATPLKFLLEGGHSMQFNSDDLENGSAKFSSGAFGDGHGKWRLEVTGEFDGMVVQAMSRNTIDDTVTNLTDADNSKEQKDENKLDF